MATVNEECASIVDIVINSQLDFSIHQTPYSIHFSLRKKFSKNPNKFPLKQPTESTSPNESEIDLLRQALLNTTNEYRKLYDLYHAESEAKSKLEGENHYLIETLNSAEKSVENVKKLKNETESLKEKLGNKSLEIKHLKSEVENMRKEKNSLSVAFKASKCDMKELNKDFEKRRIILENKIVELSDYKTVKLEEERDERIRKKKELKKEKQRMKRESNSGKNEKRNI